MDNPVDFLNAIKAGDITQVKTFLAGDPQLVNARDEQGVSALLTAVYYGWQDIIDELLQHQPPLDIWEASAIGRTDRVIELLDQDSSLLNAFSPDGFTPLGLAAFFGRREVLEKLVSAGAEVNIASHNEMHVQPLHSATATSNPNTAREIMELLLSKGAHVNEAQTGGWTPLHEAAARGEMEMVRLLLQYGADRHAKNDDGRTPADMAKEKGHETIAAML